MTNDILNAVISTVSPLIVDLLVAVLTIAFTALLAKLRKVQALKNVTSAIELMQDAVVDTVHANQQLIVDGLKAATGKLTPGEIAALQARTIDRVRAKIGPSITTIIEAAGMDLDKLILDNAEAVLRELKKADAESAAIVGPADDAGYNVREQAEREREEAKATLDEYFETECNKQAAELAEEMA